MCVLGDHHFCTFQNLSFFLTNEIEGIKDHICLLLRKVPGDCHVCVFAYILRPEFSPVASSGDQGGWETWPVDILLCGRREHRTRAASDISCGLSLMRGN